MAAQAPGADGLRGRVAVVASLAALILLSRAGSQGSLNSGLALFVADTTNEWLLIIFALMIIGTASRELRGQPSVFSLHPMVKLGEWSFAFYLVHATVIYTALGAFGSHPGWNGLLWYPPLLAVSIGLAAAVHLWVEKPLERKIRHGWDARRDRLDQPAPEFIA